MPEEPAAPQPFRHHALIHDSDQELVSGLLPFVSDGLTMRQPVVVVAEARTRQLLNEALGSGQAEVRFLDPAVVYEQPGRAIAGFAEMVGEYLSAGTDLVRLVGEVPFGSREREQREWMRYESAINDVFASLPVWSVCAYNERSLPADVLAGVARTHPLLITGRRPVVRERSTAPTAFLRGSAARERQGAAVLAQFELRDLGEARRTVRDMATGRGMGSARAEQFVNAVNEIATNALTHGLPPATLTVMADEDAVACEVTDQGPGIDDPLASFRLPADDEQEGGRGLWLARELCETVELETRPAGFAVVLRMNLP